MDRKKDPTRKLLKMLWQKDDLSNLSDPSEGDLAPGSEAMV
jgi:hypothetical protein